MHIYAMGWTLLPVLTAGSSPFRPQCIVDVPAQDSPRWPPHTKLDRLSSTEGPLLPSAFLGHGLQQVSSLGAQEGPLLGE